MLKPLGRISLRISHKIIYLIAIFVGINKTTSENKLFNWHESADIKEMFLVKQLKLCVQLLWLSLDYLRK